MTAAALSLPGIGRPPRGGLAGLGRLLHSEWTKIRSVRSSFWALAILTVTANGYGKRTPLDDYRKQNRGGQGVITIRTSDRNGPVIGVGQVTDPDEVMLIKCFDSADDGRARFVPHAAFVDPTTPAGALPRESIELRTLAFYEA